jgi:hypothetical protein
VRPPSARVLLLLLPVVCVCVIVHECERTWEWPRVYLGAWGGGGAKPKTLHLVISKGSGEVSRSGVQLVRFRFILLPGDVHVQRRGLVGSGHIPRLPAVRFAPACSREGR